MYVDKPISDSEVRRSSRCFNLVLAPKCIPRITNYDHDQRKQAIPASFPRTPTVSPPFAASHSPHRQTIRRHPPRLPPGRVPPPLPTPVICRLSEETIARVRPPVRVQSLSTEMWCESLRDNGGVFDRSGNGQGECHCAASG